MNLKSSKREAASGRAKPAFLARLERWLPPAEEPSSKPATLWWWLAMGATAIIATLFGVFIATMPLQLSDMLQNMLAAEQTSWRDTLAPLLHPEARWRPLNAIMLKFFYAISQGHYLLTFKAVNITMVVALLLLIARLMRVTTAVDFAAAVIALYVVVGLNTFYDLVVEGYPLFNHLVPVLATAITANLAYSRGGLLVDVAAILCFIIAVLNAETGFLIPVVLVSAYIIGWRGVSRGALAVILVLALGSVGLHVSEFGSGASLITNPSGLGFRRPEPEELQAIFAGHMYLYYIHNVVVSLLSVLFAEPQGGVWHGVSSLMGGRTVSTNRWVEIASSTLLTILIALYAIRRRRAWLSLELDHSDRLVLLALPMLVANGALSFAYLKNIILATAGLFWALAGYAAIRDILDRLTMPDMKRWRAALAVIAVALLSVAFVLRTMSAHYLMWKEARHSQSAWVTVYASRDSYIPTTDEGRVLVNNLRNLALVMPVPANALIPKWIRRYADN